MNKLPDLSDAVTAAKSLLGWKLVHESAEGRTAGYIVETEAYSQAEPSSHPYRGKTKRNQVMFERAGLIYVYFTYGMHYCVNIVTGELGHRQAVLIRALEPVEGIELMMQRRGKEDVRKLANGPANLVQAMGITMQNYADDVLDRQGLYLEPGIKPNKIVQTTRIGIRVGVDLPWRFYIADSPFISQSKPTSNS